MKLKTLIYSILGVAALALNSCSNVDEEDRYIYMPPPEVGRNVLIEDFTGQNCVNCPNAHELVDELLAHYGNGQVVAVSIHAGALAIANDAKHPYGLKFPLGDEYNNHWGIESWPMGLVNRTGVLPYTSWSAAVYSEIQKTTPLDIHVATDYNESNRVLTINVSTLAGSAVNGKLQVWLTEDGIVSRQMMPNGKRNNNYVHNNVLRDAVNGTWGVDYNAAAGAEIPFNYTYTVPEDWEAENLAVVAFVYNDSGVQQVVRKPLKEVIVNDTTDTPTE